MSRFASAILVAALAGCAVSCGSQPSSNSGSTGSGSSPSGDAVQITGREKFGWSQAAETIAAYQFAVYVDGTRTPLPNATCTAAAAGQFECDSPLPPLSPGRHTLEVVAVVVSDGQTIESAKAAPLNVIMTGNTLSTDSTASLITAPASLRMPAGPSNARVSTGCGLSALSDLEVLMWDETGAIRVVDRTSRSSRALAWQQGDDEHWVPSGATPHPGFSDNHWIYLAHLRTVEDKTTLRVSRYRAIADRLGERMVILQLPLHSRPTHIALSFGPNNLLYAALLFGTDSTSASADRQPFLIRIGETGVVPVENGSGSAFTTATAINPVAIAWDAGEPWIIDRGRGGGAYLLRPALRESPAQRLTGIDRPVALQGFASRDDRHLLIFGGDGELQLMSNLSSGWRLRSRIHLSTSLGTIRDALVFENGSVMTCGETADGSRSYGVWRGRPPV